VKSFLATVLAATILAAACSSSSSGSDANRPASPSSSGQPPVTAEPSTTGDPTAGSVPVRFRTSDGARLAGRLFGSGTVAVILAHQIDDDQSDWFDFAAELWSRGYEALTFNLRGVCSSTPEQQCSDGAVDPNAAGADVIGAVRFVQSKGATSVVLIGASLGGEAVIVAASKLGPDIRGVVTLSASEGLVGLVDLSVARKRVAAIAEPKLFMAGGGDRGFADAARDYFAHAKEPKELHLFPLGDHGVALLHSAEGAAVRGLIFEFLGANAAGGG
jgi:pimeloyl-ACP methyl ester carboxylesterase